MQSQADRLVYEILKKRLQLSAVRRGHMLNTLDRCLRSSTLQVCQKVEFNEDSVYKIGIAILGDLGQSILTMYTKLENCIKIPCAANCCFPKVPTKESRQRRRHNSITMKSTKKGPVDRI